MTDREIYYGDFERDGEEAVRNKLALRQYGEKRSGLAEAWLEQRSQAKADAGREAEMELARRATEAAEGAASAAREANRIARDARSIAYFCAGVALVSVAFSLFALLIS